MHSEQVSVTYLIETPHSVEKIADKIAGDQSTSTFTDVPGENRLRERYRAEVTHIKTLETVNSPSLPIENAGDFTEFHRALVTIAFPLEIIGTDIASLLTIVAGGVFAIRGLTGIRMMDITLPPAFGEAHPGPQFGIDGTRKLTNVYDRPIIASIIKPNIGLTPEYTAELVQELVEAGVDFIKDDEKLMSPDYSPVAKRVEAIMPIIHAHAERTGKKVMYAFNISSADPEQMVRNHDLVAKAGGNCAVISINQIGYGAFAYLRRYSQLAIHAHRNGWGAFNRHPYIGMDFAFYNKIWRLLGVDQFQINGLQGKYWEGDDSVVHSFHECMKPMFSDTDRAMPVIASGQWGGQAPETYRRTGTIDLMYLAGGGIVGHPDGAAAGVRAVRQAWEAAMQGIDLHDYAKTHPELKRSIEKFGKS